MRRLTMLVVALFILAGGVAAVAEVDHRHKNARMTPAAYEASWYCQHRGQRCQEPQAAEINGAWHHRERFYRVSFWALSLGGLTALVLRLRLHPRKQEILRQI